VRLCRRTRRRRNPPEAGSGDRAAVRRAIPGAKAQAGAKVAETAEAALDPALGSIWLRPRSSARVAPR
jgi:hypothetical protein